MQKECSPVSSCFSGSQNHRLWGANRQADDSYETHTRSTGGETAWYRGAGGVIHCSTPLQILCTTILWDSEGTRVLCDIKYL